MNDKLTTIIRSKFGFKTALQIHSELWGKLYWRLYDRVDSSRLREHLLRHLEENFIN